MRVGVVTLFGTNLASLPGLIVSEALPVGIGVGGYSLVRIATYRWLRNAGYFGVNPTFIQIGADLSLVLLGVFALSANLGEFGSRIALGWLGYGTVGLIQTILIRTMNFDPLATITMGNPHSLVTRPV